MTRGLAVAGAGCIATTDQPFRACTWGGFVALMGEAGVRCGCSRSGPSRTS